MICGPENSSWPMVVTERMTSSSGAAQNERERAGDDDLRIGDQA